MVGLVMTGVMATTAGQEQQELKETMATQDVMVRQEPLEDRVTLATAEPQETTVAQEPREAQEPQVYSRAWTPWRSLFSNTNIIYLDK